MPCSEDIQTLPSFNFKTHTFSKNSAKAYAKTGLPSKKETKRVNKERR